MDLFSFYGFKLKQARVSGLCTLNKSPEFSKKVGLKHTFFVLKFTKDSLTTELKLKCNNYEIADNEARLILYKDYEEYNNGTYTPD